MDFTNDDFIRCWNEILTPKWDRFRHILSGNGEIHSTKAFEYWPAKEGAKVVDIGCGYGETCLSLAEHVGPAGKVVGIDCCKSFLETAREELARTEHKNVEYILGDAQRYDFPNEEFDLAFSRFGIMFFENRVAAMKNIYRSLKPGGHLMLIVWRSLQDNLCWNIGKKVALRHLEQPEITETCGPGPFSMASENVSRSMLAAAGFKKINLFQQYDVNAYMGKDIEDAIEFQLQVGPSGEIIRESKEKGQAALPLIRKDLRQELAEHLQGNEVWMPSSSWIIVAEKSV